MQSYFYLWLHYLYGIALLIRIGWHNVTEFRTPVPFTCCQDGSEPHLSLGIEWGLWVVEIIFMGFSWPLSSEYIHIRKDASQISHLQNFSIWEYADCCSICSRIWWGINCLSKIWSPSYHNFWDMSIEEMKVYISDSKFSSGLIPGVFWSWCKSYNFYWPLELYWGEALIQMSTFILVFWYIFLHVKLNTMFTTFHESWMRTVGLEISIFPVVHLVSALYSVEWS